MIGRITELFVVVALLLSLPACGITRLRGSGEIETQERQIDDLPSVSVCCGFHVTLSEGQESSVTLTGDDNILERIVVRSSAADNKIFIRPDETGLIFRPTQPVEVEVVLSDVRGIEGSGGIELDAAPIETTELNADFGGGARADFEDIQAETFDLVASGGGEITARGEVDRQEVQLSGGSRYRAAGLVSSEADLRLSGGSEARIRVSDSLQVDASGGSEVRYSGDPSVSENVSGGSSVERVN